MKKIKYINHFNYNFKNKVVLVTGASQGLGFEVAKSFLINGANLVICSSNLKRIKEAYFKLKNKEKGSKAFIFKKSMYLHQNK